MRVSDLIEQLDDWQTKTIDEVWTELNELAWQYLDSDNYTWGGVADVLGNDGTEALRAALENNGSKWAVYALGGQPGLQLTRPEIQEALYLFEAAGLVPNASKLAKHVKRVVSLLELHNLAPNKSLVATVLSGMQLGAIKREKKVIASTRYNAYCAAMEAWDGSPDTEPTL
jgi:hypothetical protein